MKPESDHEREKEVCGVEGWAWSMCNMKAEGGLHTDTLVGPLRLTHTCTLTHDHTDRRPGLYHTTTQAFRPHCDVFRHTDDACSHTLAHILRIH